MDNKTDKPTGRRTVLRSAAVGAVGLLAGLAGGMKLQSPSHPRGAVNLDIAGWRRMAYRWLERICAARIGELSVASPVQQRDHE